MKEKIEKAIANALISLGAGEARFIVERPRAMAHGDYATNAALVAKVDPQELSSKLRNLLSSDEIEKIEVVGKFVNFCLSRPALRLSASTIRRTSGSRLPRGYGASLKPKATQAISRRWARHMSLAMRRTKTDRQSRK